MSLAEKLINDFNNLSTEKQMEVIDFVEFLKQRKNKDMENMMDDIISNNREALEELAK